MKMSAVPLTAVIIKGVVMHSYLLFCWYSYGGGSGGMNDFVGSFETVFDAKNYVETSLEPGCDRAEIVEVSMSPSQWRDGVHVGESAELDDLTAVCVGELHGDGWQWRNINLAYSRFDKGVK